MLRLFVTVSLLLVLILHFVVVWSVRSRVCPLCLSISASIVRRQIDPSRKCVRNKGMLFLSSDKSMFYCCNQSSEPLFTGQLLFHHQARPLTHPSLQWCWCCRSPVLFLRVCLSAFVRAIIPRLLHVLTRLHETAGWSSTMHAWQNKDFNPCFQSPSHQPSSVIHPCSFIHPCICHSSSSSSIYCPSRNTCLRKDEERLSFLF